MNVIERVEIELAYLEAAVQYFSHYATRTLSTSLLIVVGIGLYNCIRQMVVTNKQIFQIFGVKTN